MNDASAPLARLSISLPADLMAQLDAMVAERRLPSRSQMIAELIRHELADHAAGCEGAVLAGAVTLVYRAETAGVREALARTQGDFLKEVISSLHVFLEDEQSMEVLLVQGPAERLRDLCDQLRGVRGVQQLDIFTTTALLPPLHAHAEDDR